jgi:hypothetical protein
MGQLAGSDDVCYRIMDDVFLRDDASAIRARSAKRTPGVSIIQLAESRQRASGVSQNFENNPSLPEFSVVVVCALRPVIAIVRMRSCLSHRPQVGATPHFGQIRTAW